MDHTELESTFVGTPLLRRTGQWILELLSPLLYPNTVASSKYLEQLFGRRLQGLGIKRNILHLPFAGESTAASLGETRASELRSSLQPLKVVLYMGSLYPAYGVFDLLKALHELRRSRTDWLCVFAGNGPARDELKRQTERAGMTEAVRFPGRLQGDELAAWLKAAAVFVSPMNDTVTDWARCPGKTFIYMLFEKPIVTCRVGENLVALGDDGFYYRPGDSVSMCHAINRALDASEQWRPAYRKEDHTWQARAGVYERWLLSIQGHRRPVG
jgi:glycosyltransferase involved in cell wall biosynthesis